MVVPVTPGWQLRRIRSQFKAVCHAELPSHGQHFEAFYDVLELIISGGNH